MPFIAPKSPCQKKCQLDKDKICIACGRAVEEIATWSGMSNAEKIQCINDARRRLQAKDQDAE